MEGWIKLHRQITDNPLYFSEPFTRLQAWIDMLIIANHKPGFFYKRGIRIVVECGQIGYDMDTLGKRWKWSRGKVTRFIKELENDLQVVRQITNVTTLISIVNYKTYQADSKANNTADSKANGHQTDTNKKDKNDKEIIIYNKFYDYELKIAKLHYEKNKESENFEDIKNDCLEFHDFICWLFCTGKYLKKDIAGNSVIEKKTNLLNLKKQLTFINFTKLKNLCKDKRIDLRKIFESMENWDLKKRCNLYMTALTFVNNTK